MRKLLLYWSAVLFFILAAFSVNGQITNVVPLVSASASGTDVYNPTYSKIELGVTLDAAIDAKIQAGTLNPYNDRELDLSAELYDAQTNVLVKKVYGFYMVEYNLDTDGQALTPKTTQSYNWRLRFVVEDPKKYILKIKLVYNRVQYTYTTSFNIYGTPSTNHGYLRFPKGQKYMEFTDKTPFFGIAETMDPYDVFSASSYDATGVPSGALSISRKSPNPYYPTNVVKSLKQVVNEFADYKGNFVKFYFHSSAIDLEWDRLGNYTSYQNRASDFDQIVENMERRKVYMQLGIWTWELFNHGDLPDFWNNNPYKTISNVDMPADLFVNKNNCSLNTTALVYLKRKIRYTIARWGYSPSVASLEMMTEIDKVDEYWDAPSCGGSKPNQYYIDTGFAYLATYAKQLSGRILSTTGVASYYGSGNVFFNNDVCDYVDFHGYNEDLINAGCVGAYLAEWTKTQYNKPFHQGEYGPGGTDKATWYNSIDSNAADPLPAFTNKLWASSFSGSFSSAMYFGIFGYMHSKQWNMQAYKRFKPLYEFFKDEDLIKGRYEPVKNKCVSYPLDCNSNITPPDCRNGVTSGNPNFQLAQTLLYNYDVSRDKMNANPNTTPSPVKTSNDAFIEVYALRSPKKMIGWVHNKTNYFYNLPHHSGGDASQLQYYTHPDASGNKGSAQFGTYVTDIPNSTMTVEGLNCAGTYKIEWFKTSGNGGVISSLTVNNLQPVNGKLTLVIPPLIKRDAFSASQYEPDYGFKISMTNNEQYVLNGKWENAYANINAQPASGYSIATDNDGRIYYRGTDGELHYYYYDDHCWEHNIISVYGDNDKISTWSAIAVSKLSNRIFYINNVNRVEQIYRNAQGGYVPYMHISAPVAAPSSPIVVGSTDLVYYRSANGYLTVIKWNGSSWVGQELTSLPPISITSNIIVIGSDKIFYKNSNNDVQQVYWSNATNSWIGQTHTNAAKVHAASKLVLNKNNENIIYTTVNSYIGIVAFNPQTNLWDARELSSMPKVAYGANIALNSSNQIFYHNINGNVQEIYGNWNQWIGYTLWMNDMQMGSPLAINSSDQMFYINQNNKLQQIYWSASSNSWVPYGHSNASVKSNTAMVIDDYDKVFYVGNADSKINVAWFDNPCAVAAPCTINAYRKNLAGETLQQEEKNTLIYPNPSQTGIFKIATSDIVYNIDIFNSLGEKVKYNQSKEEKDIVINLMHAPSGIYMVVLQTNSGTISQKVVIAK